MRTCSFKSPSIVEHICIDAGRATEKMGYCLKLVSISQNCLDIFQFELDPVINSLGIRTALDTRTENSFKQNGMAVAAAGYRYGVGKLD